MTVTEEKHSPGTTNISQTPSLEHEPCFQAIALSVLTTPLDRRYDSVMLHVGNTLPFWSIVDLKASFRRVESPAGTVAR